MQRDNDISYEVHSVRRRRSNRSDTHHVLLCGCVTKYYNFLLWHYFCTLFNSSFPRLVLRLGDKQAVPVAIQSPSFGLPKIKPVTLKK